MYVDAPAIEGARLVAVIADAPGGKRLSTPIKVAVRIQDEIVDVSCACRHPRICEHVVWLLVDVAFHPALRAAIASGVPTAPHVATRVDTSAVSRGAAKSTH